jgi:hypothetical protein
LDRSEKEGFILRKGKGRMVERWKLLAEYYPAPTQECIFPGWGGGGGGEVEMEKKEDVADLCS